MASSSPYPEESRVNTSPSRGRYIVLANIPDLGLFIGDVIEKRSAFGDYMVINRYAKEKNGFIRPFSKYEELNEVPIKMPLEKCVIHQTNIGEVKDTFNEDIIQMINMSYYTMKDKPAFLTILTNHVKDPPASPASASSSSVCAIAGGRRRATARRKHPRHKSRRRATTRKHSRK
jgi:hypothetical protein